MTNLKTTILSIFFLFTAAALSAQTPLIISASEYKFRTTEKITSTVSNDKRSFLIKAQTLPTEAAINFALGKGVVITPDTEYTASYSFDVKELKANTSVFLMIREHAAEKAPVLHKNYFKESTNVRKVDVNMVNTSVNRNLNFKTGSDTNYLTASIAILGLDGELSFSQLTINRK